MSLTSFILRTAAPDGIGILADVMSYLASLRLNVQETHDFADSDTSRFYIWARFEAPDDFDTDGFAAGFAALAARRSIDWTLRREQDRPRALIMVSKGDHCLNDLLYRHRRKRLGADIVAIVSNHPDAKWHADRHDIPFHHVPVTKDTKGEAEDRLRELITQSRADMVVLARYMQVLSDGMCQRLAGRAINIHHSFLPSFKGARPYWQAHERGVKLIGATAHYVTADLDEGPIIEQDVARVDHSATVEDLTAVGRDTESQVLARAVKWHGEHRVLLNGQRTVVFR